MYLLAPRPSGPGQNSRSLDHAAVLLRDRAVDEGGQRRDLHEAIFAGRDCPPPATTSERTALVVAGGTSMKRGAAGSLTAIVTTPRLLDT